MFKTLIAPIFDLFENDIVPILDEDEKKSMRPKFTSILYEGVKFQAGGQFGKGRIVMTKHVDSIDINEFFHNLIHAINFPGLLSIDAHGFVQTPEGEPIFLFGSPNSSIYLWDGEQDAFLQR